MPGSLRALDFVYYVVVKYNVTVHIFRCCVYFFVYLMFYSLKTHSDNMVIILPSPKLEHLVDEKINLTQLFLKHYLSPTLSLNLYTLWSNVLIVN